MKTKRIVDITASDWRHEKHWRKLAEAKMERAAIRLLEKITAKS